MPESFIGPELSRQFIYFSADYMDVGLWSVENWMGFETFKQEEIFLLREMGYRTKKLYFGDFEKREAESRKAFKEIQFPDILAEVSGIIREYAIYSLYDFLVEGFEKLEYRLCEKRAAEP